MKTAAILMLCVIVSVGLAANNNKTSLKKKIVLGRIEIKSKPDTKSMKRELEQFQLETRQLKKHLVKLQKTIQDYGVHADNDIKINEHF